jgi:hypothetical protein
MVARKITSARLRSRFIATSTRRKSSRTTVSPWMNGEHAIL